MNNIQLKHYAAGLGVRMWELAKQLGISENTLTRRLRNELPEDERRIYQAAIEKIAGSRAG